MEDSANIVQGNALQLDWTEIVDPSKYDFIIGDPPFLGARNQSKEQKAELKKVFQGARNVGNIDYVAGWYMQAAQYVGDEDIRCAVVSTNSRCTQS